MTASVAEMNAIVTRPRCASVRFPVLAVPTWRNVKGNEQFRKLAPIAKRGGVPDGEAEENAIRDAPFVDVGIREQRIRV